MTLRERDSSPPVSLSVGEQLSHPAQAVLITALLRPDLEERGIHSQAVRPAEIDLPCRSCLARSCSCRVAWRRLCAISWRWPQRISYAG